MTDHSNEDVKFDNFFTPRNVYGFDIDRQDEYESLNRNDDPIARNTNRRNWPMIQIGLIIMFSPFVIAFGASLIYGGSMFNEGTGTGVYLWFIVITIPVGLLIIMSSILIRMFRFLWRMYRY